MGRLILRSFRELLLIYVFLLVLGQAIFFFLSLNLQMHKKTFLVIELKLIKFQRNKHTAETFYFQKNEQINAKKANFLIMCFLPRRLMI